MAASYNLAFDVAANSADNLCRWDGESAGHYEVWFLTLNERASQRGFWFRYAIETPQLGSEDARPRAELWASFFDRAEPEMNFGLIRECPIDTFTADRNRFAVRLDEASLSSTRASGRVASQGHSIFWDLHFTANPSTYHHVSPRIYSLIRPSSFICSPNLDTRFSGIVRVDGREFVLANEPGCQSHLWGSKHVDDWVWVHSNAFEKHEESVFEGLAARPRRSGRLLPPLQSLFLRHRGEDHHFVRLRFAEQWQRSLGTGYWKFSARNTRMYLEGTAQCRMRDMLQARYVDPDGEPLYCLNSEVANLKIRIFKRLRGIHWRHCETINAHATAHLEHASRSLDDQVRLI
jgi:hypothetical protein